MKIQPLNDLQKEIDRIFVAGSRFAKGDPRLLKQIPVFEKLGQKVPIFQKLKSLLVELTESEQSQEKLLETSILIYSILNTLSDATENSELEEINTSLDNAKIRTYLPYSKLKTLQGMFGCTIKYDQNYIKKACDDAILDDIRIIEYVANSINLTNIYLTDFVENYIAKKIPLQLFPYIYKDFDVTGGKKEVTKFRIINDIDQKAGKDLIEQILIEGSVDLKVEAIKILGNDIKNEETILCILKEKKRPIIEACTYELCNMGSKQGIKISLDLFKTNKYNYVVKSLNICKDETIFEDLFQEVKATYEKFVESDTDPKSVKEIEKLGEIFKVLENKSNEEQIYEFVIEVIKNKKVLKLSKENYEVKRAVENIISIIKYFGDIKYITSLQENEKLVKAYPVIIQIYFKSVCNVLDKEKIFDVFSNYFQHDYLDIYLFNEYKRDVKIDTYNYFNYGVMQIDPNKVDKRFTTLYLNKLLKMKTKDYDSNAIIMFIQEVIDCDDEKELELLYNFFIKCVNSKTTLTYVLGTVARILLKVNYKNILDETIKMFQGKSNEYYIRNGLDEEFLIDKISKDYEQTFRDLYDKTKNNYYLNIANGLQNKDRG